MTTSPATTPALTTATIMDTVAAAGAHLLDAAFTAPGCARVIVTADRARGVRNAFLAAGFDAAVMSPSVVLVVANLS